MDKEKAIQEKLAYLKMIKKFKEYEKKQQELAQQPLLPLEYSNKLLEIIGENWYLVRNLNFGTDK